jgi:prepilin-type N-terminal cleavage/methylation domain-containing protein
MKNRKGFTLIEMLVVIAVVGILSAAVLASLGPARNKAKDARIISALNQLRSVAETLYDGDYDAVDTDQTEISKLAQDITNNQGELKIQKSSETTALAYLAYSKLPGGGYYCVDSAGNAKNLTSAPGDTVSVCPNGN